jgi:(S)-ureidoglycine aminohydrolase
MRTPTAHPAPGIIGHNRTMLPPHYCVFPPEGITDSLLPAWPGCNIRFQISPAMAARLAQALLIVPAGLGSAGLLDDGREHFFCVQQGAFTLTAHGETATRSPGGFADILAGMAFALAATADGEARAIWVKRPYEPASGVDAPGAEDRPSRHRPARGQRPALVHPSARH